MNQRTTMKGLKSKIGNDKETVCLAYAVAEKRGEVQRKRNDNGVSSEKYAHLLWYDGTKRGWL